MVKNSKKAISPVVATALLLVVAVVAVVGFQTWFNTYQSGLTSDIEEQSSADLVVERLEYEESGGAVRVYIKNSGDNQTGVNSVTVLSEGTEYCSNSTSGSVGANTVGNWRVDCPTSVNRTLTYDVVLVTNDGVFSESEVLR